MRSQASLTDSDDASDTFGCSLGNLETNMQLISNDIKIYRKRSGPKPVQVSTASSARGFLIGVSVTGGHKRRIFGSRGEKIYNFAANSIYVRGFDEDYRAELSGAFDFVLMEISTPGLQRIATNSDVRNVSRLVAPIGLQDATLGGLAGALFANAKSGEPSSLFVDQVSHAIGAHLVQTYAFGHQPEVRNKLTLSPAKAARAKEMLWHNLGENVSIDDLAKSCLMSRHAFLQAFKNTTGTTPYGWLSAQRMEAARGLLLTPKVSIVDVATACGYATQSQFTRAFKSYHGESPGVWRKRRER